MRCRDVLTLAGPVLLAGCASIKSTPTDTPGDGLVYYMPKRDIVVTVVKPAAAASEPTVTIGTTNAYPDVSRPYVLAFDRNLIGTNAMNVGVGTNGLLTSSKSTTTSGVSEALKNLATSVGSISPRAALAPVAQACSPGTHSFIYQKLDVQAAGKACEFDVVITRIAAARPSASAPSADDPPKRKDLAHTGVFYRQEEAFRVEVSNATSKTTSIVLSPSLSPVRFLPIERTLFANNQADFGFTEGMPTKFDQNADGELIGLLKLPADVIGAYFGAVGKMFEAFKTRDEGAANALNASLQLELAKKKYDACIAAIQAKNDEMVKQLDCGK